MKWLTLFTSISMLKYFACYQPIFLFIRNITASKRINLESRTVNHSIGSYYFPNCNYRCCFLSLNNWHFPMGKKWPCFLETCKVCRFISLRKKCRSCFLEVGNVNLFLRHVLVSFFNTVIKIWYNQSIWQITSEMLVCLCVWVCIFMCV